MNAGQSAARRGSMARMMTRAAVAAAMALAVLGITAPAEAKQPVPKCRVSVTEAPLLAPTGFIKVTTTTKCRNVTTVTVAFVPVRRAPIW